MSLQSIIKTTRLQVGGAELDPVPPRFDCTDNHYEHNGGDDEEEQGQVQRRHKRGDSPDAGAQAEGGYHDATAAVQERENHSGIDDSSSPYEQSPWPTKENISYPSSSSAKKLGIR